MVWPHLFCLPEQGFVTVEPLARSTRAQRRQWSSSRTCPWRQSTGRMRPGAAPSSASGALCPRTGSHVSLLAASPTSGQHDLCCPVDFLACLLRLQCAATRFGAGPQQGAAAATCSATAQVAARACDGAVCGARPRVQHKVLWCAHLQPGVPVSARLWLTSADQDARQSQKRFVLCDQVTGCDRLYVLAICCKSVGHQVEPCQTSGWRRR